MDENIMILNLLNRCNCACKYCLLCANVKMSNVTYSDGEQLAKKFYDWSCVNNEAIDICYVLGYCLSEKDIVKNVEFNKSIKDPGYKYLQMNGISFKSNSAIREFLLSIINAGVEYIDVTIYGNEYYHDTFSARKGDYQFMNNVIKCAIELKLNINVSIPVFESNWKSVSEYIGQLNEINSSYINIYPFLPDFRGFGVHLDNDRITLSTYNKFDNVLKNYISLKKYKTQKEWCETNEWSIVKDRSIRISLTDYKIDYLMSTPCDQILEEIVETNKKITALLPSKDELNKIYGDYNNVKLYQERDLYWMWVGFYCSETKILTSDYYNDACTGMFRY